MRVDFRTVTPPMTRVRTHVPGFLVEVLLMVLEGSFGKNTQTLMGECLRKKI